MYANVPHTREQALQHTCTAHVKEQILKKDFVVGIETVKKVDL